MKAGTPSPASTACQSANDERLQAELHAAYANGQARGEREGFVSGWRWGLFCGAFAVAVVGAIATAAVSL